MLSLDETGKLHVFTIPTTTSSSDANEMNPTRTIRTAERPTFVRMLGDRLWTASGPLTRSTTNPSLRGPTIRVYEPLGIGTSGTTTTGGAGRTTYTSEWTGAVTSLAVLSTDSSRVYLAHEGGYISVFHRESLACEAVLKVSSSDVLALEGVGGRLWAGYRTGVVCVYEVGCVPWVTVNMWMAHPYVGALGLILRYSTLIAIAVQGCSDSADIGGQAFGRGGASVGLTVGNTTDGMVDGEIRGLDLGEGQATRVGRAPQRRLDR
jgi:hypothetical protein